MNFSYGFVETQGFVAAIEAADAMVKVAKVEIVKWRKAGGALVMIVVKGELGACRAAVDAGSAAAQQVGVLVASNVIANPYTDTELLVQEYLGRSSKKKKQPKKTALKVGQMFSPKTKLSTPKKTTKPASKTIAQKKKIVKAKKGTTNKIIPSASYSPSEQILNLISRASDGMNLEQLAQAMNKPAAEIRQLIKKLMDRNVVEKVRKQYFLIGPRSKK